MMFWYPCEPLGGEVVGGVTVGGVPDLNDAELNLPLTEDNESLLLNKNRK